MPCTKLPFVGLEETSEVQRLMLLEWCAYMQVRKQQLELDMEQQTSSISGKEYVKAVYCHCLFNLYAEYIM